MLLHFSNWEKRSSSSVSYWSYLKSSPTTIITSSYSKFLPIRHHPYEPPSILCISHPQKNLPLPWDLLLVMSYFSLHKNCLKRWDFIHSFSLPLLSHAFEDIPVRLYSPLKQLLSISCHFQTQWSRLGPHSVLAQLTQLIIFYFTHCSCYWHVLSWISLAQSIFSFFSAGSPVLSHWILKTAGAQLLGLFCYWYSLGNLNCSYGFKLTLLWWFPNYMPLPTTVVSYIQLPCAYFHLDVKLNISKYKNFPWPVWLSIIKRW